MDTQTHPSGNFSFTNTQIAFQDKNDEDLKNASLLFSSFDQKWLLFIGPALAKFGFAVGLPIKGLIKRTLFRQFCGGETIEDCAETIEKLSRAKIGTILDYSVEGQEDEVSFDHTASEIIKTIDKASESGGKIPFSVFKVTGIGSTEIMAKGSDPEYSMTGNEEAEMMRLRDRFNRIINHASTKNVRIFVDAEESWIQPAIDKMTDEAAMKYNIGTTIVYNTLQMYRHDRLAYLKTCIEHAKVNNYRLGFKLVRGAYMEKERKRAEKYDYASPIHKNKAGTDKDYDEAVKICLDEFNLVNICAGTHNEQSCYNLTKLMSEKNIEASDKRIYFAQLLGMSDHISYNLAHAGFNVAKYVPYGPVKKVLPYMVRRAEENSSVKGQAGRELSLIKQEQERRKNQKQQS